MKTTAVRAFGHDREQLPSDEVTSRALTSDSEMRRSIKKLIELSARRRLAKKPAEASVERTGISVFTGVQGVGAAADTVVKPTRLKNIPVNKKYRMTTPESFRSERGYHGDVRP